jgi:hypothetical protein
VITRVLPEPAPARTRTGPSTLSTASRCGGFSPSTRKRGTDGTIYVPATIFKLDNDEMNLDTRYRQLAFGMRIRRKDQVWHQRAIHHVLRLVTLGGQGRYLSHYVTTIGDTVYVTPDWEARSLADRYATLRHERVHLEQFRRYGLLPMAIAYLLLPLPFGLAWCRMRLERQAYEETIRVHHELGTLDENLRAHVMKQFVSGSYGWMWPFPRKVARWYDEFVGSLSVDK